jgi:translocation and assembly module TamB
MTRPFRVALISAGGIILLLLIIVLAGVAVIRTQWFYNKVRDRIVTEVEKATGGRVEIQSFAFDWRTLTATVRDFTVHGLETPQEPPLLRADQIVVGLKIISIWKRDIDIALLRIDHPQAYLTIDSGGRTNIPNPKAPRKSDKSTIDTILDLAIQQFEINNGTAEIHAAGQPPKTQPYAAKGGNLRALFTFDQAVPRYHGDISVQPLDVAYGSYQPVPANITTTVAIERNKLVVDKLDIASGDSIVHLNGQLQNFTSPVATAEYRAKISLAQVGSILKLKSRQSGTLEASGAASYKSNTDYGISASVKAYDVNYQAGGLRLRNIRAEAKIDGGPKTISVNAIRATALGGEITGKAIINDFERFKVNTDLHHFDIREVASLATRQKLPYDGVISGPLFAEGRISELQHNRFIGSARLAISPAPNSIPMHGLIDAKYSGVRDQLDLGDSFIALPNTRLDVSGVLGQQLQIRFASTDLNDLVPAMQAGATPGQPPPQIPVSLTPQGLVTFAGTVNGKLTNPVLAGHLSGSNFVVQDQTIDAVDADISAQKTGASVSNGSLRQKTLTANFAGSVGLRNWKPTDDQPLTATLGVRNAGLPDLLALAGQKNVPATGTLSVNAKVAGTVGNPQATADLSLARGEIYGEPYDRLTAHLDAPDRTRQSLTAEMNAGSKQINLNAAYTHSAKEAIPGHLTFNIKSNDIALTQVVTLRQREPDLAGSVRLNAEGEGEVIRDSAGKPAFRILKINGNMNARAIQLNGKALGDISVAADTVTSTAGAAPVVDVKLRSNLATASITGDGRWTLAGDYPGRAKLDFRNVNLDTMRRLFLKPEQVDTMRFAGLIEGSLSVDGPALKPELLRASLDLPRLEVRPEPGPAGAPVPAVDLTVRNAEPIRITLANSVVRIESAKLVAPDSTFTITGQAVLSPKQDINARLNGSINLGILHMFNADIVSSGIVVADASMRGALNDPHLNGTLQLKNANLAIVDVPNGLSNANGTIIFTDNQARLQNLTAESGGGRIQAGGFASFLGGDVSFRLHANAESVRVRYPPGVSTVADANLNLVGNTQRSVLSGTVTVDRIAFNPKTDFGSLLSSSAAPPQTPSAQTGALGNLQFDVEIQTSPDITFESGLTESLEGDANLRLRGTISNPVLLGRVNITQGQLTFFGNTYTINQGSVSFFNPVKMEPILNIDLETTARGVDVTITVSGPITKLNVSYRSDPPLQFSEIVALLATGRTPNDATLAARQPTAPQQGWQQMGASALVGQAIANPVAGRLQRFFGVSKLKIDPTISGFSGSPQAKLTLEQQVTPDITFTYITDVANAQEQVIRIEWAFSKTWSAVALRDTNGQFGIDFLYKKRFK